MDEHTQDNPETIADEKLADVELADVELNTEVLEGRQRRISAQIKIAHSPDKLWELLTNYDRLADFIPNLADSRRLETFEDGKIRIEQVGAEKFLKFKFQAKVVLDMTERYPDEIHFNMVEGDFKAFSGSWTLQPWQPTSNEPIGTDLIYTVVVQPTRLMPIGLIERYLRRNLTLNLLAIRQQADQGWGQA